jgi:hypothetical protein
MTSDRDDLRDRLDAVADEVDAEPTPGDDFPIIYREVEDGYETLDGDPIPTDETGTPPGAGEHWTPIIITGEYNPNEVDDGEGDQ